MSDNAAPTQPLTTTPEVKANTTTPEAPKAKTSQEFQASMDAKRQEAFKRNQEQKREKILGKNQETKVSSKMSVEPKVQTQPQAPKQEPSPTTLEVPEEESQRESFKPKTYKVYGKEVTIKSEADLDRLAQKGLAADEALQKAGQAERLFTALRDNPSEVLPVLLQKLGIDKDELVNFAYSQLNGHVEEQMMSKEEREYRAQLAELEQFRAEKAAREEAEQREYQEHLKQQYRQHFSNEIVKTLQTAGMPANDFVVSRMGYYLKYAMDKGYNEVEPLDVVHLVKADWDNYRSQVFKQTNDSELLESLGEDRWKNINQAQMNKIKPNPLAPQVSATEREQTHQVTKRPATPEDIRKRALERLR